MLVVSNSTRGTILGQRVFKADSFLARLVGLLNRSQLLAGEGLLLTRTRAIHTWGMRFAIDCVFLDDNNRVVAEITGLTPWRFSPIIHRATSVLELPVGTIESSQTRVGDYLTIG